MLAMVVAYIRVGGLHHLGAEGRCVASGEDALIYYDLAVNPHGADGVGVDCIGELLDRPVQRAPTLQIRKATTINVSLSLFRSPTMRANTMTRDSISVEAILS